MEDACWGILVSQARPSGMAVVVQHEVCTLGNCYFHSPCAFIWTFSDIIVTMTSKSMFDNRKGVKYLFFGVVHSVLLQVELENLTNWNAPLVGI